MALSFNFVSVTDVPAPKSFGNRKESAYQTALKQLLERPGQAVKIEESDPKKRDLIRGGFLRAKKALLSGRADVTMRTTTAPDAVYVWIERTTPAIPAPEPKPEQKKTAPKKTAAPVAAPASAPAEAAAA